MSDHGTAHPDLAYEDWPYDNLRDAAFDRARQRHDLPVYVPFLARTPALTATASSMTTLSPGDLATHGHLSASSS